jgi:hypothetical protein
MRYASAQARQTYGHGLEHRMRFLSTRVRTVGAWQRKRRPDPLRDWMTSFLEEIKLRDTVGLEIAGLAVAILMCMGAISFLNPDWHADALKAARQLRTPH